MNAFDRGYMDKMAQAVSGVSPTGKPYTRVGGHYLPNNGKPLPQNPATQPRPERTPWQTVGKAVGKIFGQK